MEKSKKTIYVLLFAASALTFCVLLAASGLLGFLPISLSGKKLLGGVLIVLTPAYLAASLLLLNRLKSLAARAESCAERDPLTSFLNQQSFWEVLGYEIERSRRRGYRFSIMVINLDNFKTINDLYGHNVGDLFLADFARYCSGKIRKIDIPARYGGDNFAVVLPVCDEAEVCSVADRLMASIRNYAYPMRDGTQIRTTASIGVAVFPDNGQNEKDLFFLADSMMRHAKSSGKDRLSVPSDNMELSIQQTAGEKNILIMSAIRDNRIVPYFQPIVSVDGKTVIAYEILTRIVTATRVVPAAEFIETAESMGAIRKMDYQLIEQALRIVTQQGYTGLLFFNLSPKALVLKEFLPTVRGILTKYGIPPSQMVFEITERETVKNMSAIEPIVRGLKSEGFRFAIDDFGSGYSSFQYIKMFQVDYLKIDGEFIRSMSGIGSMENTIVQNIARLAGDLGIKTIAEYVESEPILRHVRSAGIDFAQGYHIQRPAPHLMASSRDSSRTGMPITPPSSITYH